MLRQKGFVDVNVVTTTSANKTEDQVTNATPAVLAWGPRSPSRAHPRNVRICGRDSRRQLCLFASSGLVVNSHSSQVINYVFSTAQSAFVRCAATGSRTRFPFFIVVVRLPRVSNPHD